MAKLRDMKSMAFDNYGPQLKVLAAVQKLKGEGEYPYLAAIEAETGMGRKTIITAIGDLLRAGLIDAGNARIKSGRWVRAYAVAGEGSSLARRVLAACLEG